MSFTYASRKRGEIAVPKAESAAPQPSMEALRSGAAKPTQEQLGHRVDLPDAMRSKMENAFGADLSAVKLYESEAVGNAGAEAITQGNTIAFAPGMLDFTSFGGQALLGHEISHVVSQQRGEVAGNGFLNDHALEARADQEGAMAAAGQQIAAPEAAMSSVSAAPAAGPMQAKKNKDQAPAAKSGPMAGLPTEGDLAKQAAAVARKRSEAKAAPLSRQAVYNPGKDSAVRPDATALAPQTTQESMTALGSSNLRGGSRYDRMMGSLQTINNMQSVLGIAGEDNAQYMLPAYSRAIGDMKKYRKSLGSKWSFGGIKDKKERRRQKGVIDQVLAQAKADEKRIREAQASGKTAGKSVADITKDARTVHLRDEDFEEMNGSASNTVYKYKSGYYKAPNTDESGKATVSSSDAMVMGDCGVRFGQDKKGNMIDPHQDNRELAAARLDKLLGGDVIVQSKRAEVGADSIHAGKEMKKEGTTRTFKAQGTKGILMDEAKGDSMTAYNWEIFQPEFDSEDDQSWLERDKDDSTNLGERLQKAKGFKGLSQKKSKVQSWDASENIWHRKTSEGVGTLDSADPKLQRDMNAMFLIDTLMQFGDRHFGNFKLATDKDGKYAGLKGIDNDTAFGEKTDVKTRSNERSGLPEQMHIDRKMAEKIKAVKPEQLDLIFSDLLTKEEIDAMKKRFESVSKYIDDMDEKGMLVDEWNDETAKAQLLSARGSNMIKRTEKQGNTYYQRMLMSILDKKTAQKADYYS